MAYKHPAAILALVGAFALPSTAAFAITCFDLPEYARAAGALEGLSTCDMSVAEARRILSAQGGATAKYEQVVPAPRTHHRRHALKQFPPY